MAKANIAAIQMLRAFAVIPVICLHSLNAARDRAGYDVASPQILGIGVDIFFVISGFIIAYVSVDSFSHFGAARSFLLKRAARILPAFWLLSLSYAMILAAFPSLFVLSHFDVTNAALAMLMVPGHTLLFTAWTLSFEAIFYIATSAFMPLARKWFVPGMTAIFLLGATVGHFSAPDGSDIPLLSALSLEFIAGLWLHELYVSRAALPYWIPVTALALAAIAMVNTWGADPTTHEGRAIAWGAPSLLFVFGTLFIDRTRPVSIPAILIWIGNASYSAYLLQVFMCPIFGKLGGILHLADRIPSWIFVMICVALTLALSIIFHLWIERPLSATASRILGLHNKYDSHTKRTVLQST